MVIAYAVSYAVTYIATGSAKAAQGAGLSAALFMGIGIPNITIMIEEREIDNNDQKNNIATTKPKLY
jgi:hypothetical protein